MKNIASLLNEIKSLDAEILYLKLIKIKEDLEQKKELIVKEDLEVNNSYNHQAAMDDATRQVNEVTQADDHNFLKAMLTFASGALGIFFTLLISVLKDEAKVTLDELAWSIIIASALFVAVIVMVMISFQINKLGNLKALENMLMACKLKINDPNNLPNVYKYIHTILQFFILASMVIGLCFMSYVYISLILSKTM